MICCRGTVEVNWKDFLKARVMTSGIGSSIAMAAWVIERDLSFVGDEKNASWCSLLVFRVLAFGFSEKSATPSANRESAG